MVKALIAAWTALFLLATGLDPPPAEQQEESVGREIGAHEEAPDPAEQEFHALLLLPTRTAQLERLEEFLLKYPSGRLADTGRAFWLKLRGPDLTPQEREAWLEKWVALRKEDPAVANYAAQTFADAGEATGARRLALKALELAAGRSPRERGIALAILAGLELDRNQPDQALAYLDRAQGIVSSPRLLRAFDAAGRERWSSDLGAAPPIRLLRARSLSIKGALAAAAAEFSAAAREGQDDTLHGLRATLSAAGAGGLPPAPRDLAVPPPLAPPLPLTDTAGRELSLEDFRGKVVLVSFWATWCVPCQYELPELQKLYHRLKPKGLEVLAVNMDDAGDFSDLQKWFKERELTLPLFLHTPGIERSYRLVSLPLLVLIDREGRLRLRRSGYTAGGEGELEEQVSGLLAGQGSSVGTVREELRGGVEVRFLCAVLGADAVDVAFADVDGDDISEAVVSTHEGLFAYREDGREVWSQMLPDSGGPLEVDGALLAGGEALRRLRPGAQPMILDPGFNPGFSQPSRFAALGWGSASAFFYVPGVVAFDPKGQVIWRQERIDSVAALAPLGGDVLVAGADRQWYRLGAADGAIRAHGDLDLRPTVLASFGGPEPVWFAGGTSEDKLLRYPEGVLDLVAADLLGGDGPELALATESEKLLILGQDGKTLWRGRLPEAPLRVAAAPRGRTVAVVGEEGTLFLLRVEPVRSSTAS